MSDDNNDGRNSAPGGRQPLTLKPRGAGSVSAGTVKQSFSHGRSKTVVVETKRPRTHAPAAGNLAAPSSAEKRMLDPRPSGAPAQPRPPQGGSDGRGLSAEEQAARQRAIELARQQQARQEAERRAREERARAEAEASARAAQAAAAAEAAAAAPAPQPAAAPPAPA